MQFKAFTLAALAATVYAQDQGSGGLVEVLGGSPELSNLTSFLGQYQELVSTLGGLQNITLLAPNNDALTQFLNSSAGSALAEGSDDSLIQGILTYHVLNGTYSEFGNETQFVPTALQPPQYTNVTGGQVVRAEPGDDGSVTFFSGLLANATVTGDPLNFTGGIIHIIDSVLVIPQNISATAVETNLTSAWGALNRTELTDTVDNLEDVTVFVPNNEAFRAIGNLVANLTTEDLAGILQYHVVNGSVAYSNTLENTTLTTLGGDNVTISIIDDEVFVNSAKVVVPDVLVANGVVHVIDGVLNPGNATAAPNPDDEDESDAAFEGAEETDDGLSNGAPTPTGEGPNPTEEAPGAGGAASTSSEDFAPRMTAGAMGAAALFGGAAVFANW